MLRSIRGRWALTIPFYALVPDADGWLTGGVRGGPPRVVCRLSPGRSVRVTIRPEGWVWFSATLGIQAERKAPARPASVSLALQGPRRRRRWSTSCPLAPPAGSRGPAGREWSVFLGRFRGEPIEIALEPAPSGDESEMAAGIAVGNPALHILPSVPTLLARVARRCWRTVRGDGLAGLLAEIAAAVDADRARELRYRHWIRQHGRLAPPAPAGRGGAGASGARGLSVAFVVVVRPDACEDAIDPLLDSVAAQRGAWELFAVVDRGAPEGARARLRARAGRDGRVRLVEAGDGLARGLNQAVAEATSTFLALVAPDGELAPEALGALASALDRHPRADVAYSDEDRLDPRGRRRQPFFKPDWSPYYFFSYAYLGQLCVYRAALVRAIGGFRPGSRGAEDYDLQLRVVERAREICHLPVVLWHGRTAPASSPVPLARGAGGDLDVIRRHLDGRVEAEPGLLPGTHRVRWPIPGAPLVSVVIPTRDRVHLLRRCLAGLRERTAYPRLDILVVDNGSVEAETRAFLATCGARVVRAGGPFNFSRLCNLGARHARGEHLLFLNNDTEPMSPDWLEAMLELSGRPDVGAVGAKLHYFDGRIQHVGIAVGINGTAAQIFRGAPADHAGYCGRALTIHECAAVTGACLMTRRAVWERLDGFDEAFPENFNDVDYCLRAGRAGFRVVFTPFAVLLHHEFATRPHRERVPEAALFRQRWAETVDPYYSRNLSLRHTDCSVQLAARGGAAGRALD